MRRLKNKTTIAIFGSIVISCSKNNISYLSPHFYSLATFITLGLNMKSIPLPEPRKGTKIEYTYRLTVIPISLKSCSNTEQKQQMYFTFFSVLVKLLSIFYFTFYTVKILLDTTSWHHFLTPLPTTSTIFQIVHHTGSYSNNNNTYEDCFSIRIFMEMLYAFTHVCKFYFALYVSTALMFIY